MLKRIFVFLMLALIAMPAVALDLLQGQSRSLRPEEAFKIELLGADEQGAVIGWQITPGYYLYRDNFLAKDSAGRELRVETQPGEVLDDPTFGRVEVYFNQAQIAVPEAQGQVAITWQGCQKDGICYAPIESVLDLGTGSLAAPAPAGMSTAAPTEAAAASPAAGTLQLDNSTGLIQRLDGQGGAALVLAAFLGFGLLLAFTPCVLPMVPILAGMLARQGEALRPARGALLSGTYVLAMASAFALMGAVAGWWGGNLQIMLQSPWAIATIATLFAILALSSFGLFEFSLPAGLTARLSRPGSTRGSVTGAALLGFTSALIVGPCVTAPLAGALIYIAQTGDVAFGAAALFALGLGQGIPLFIAGTFGARYLPRAGAWMQTVRLLFGFVFLGLAIWLASRLLPGPVALALWAALLIAGGVFLGALDRGRVGTGRRLAQSAGLLSLLAGVLMGIGAASGADDPLRPLARLTGGAAAPEGAGPAFDTVTSPGQLHQALAGGRPAMVYVTAAWCTTCRGIERNVLPDPVVGEALAGMQLIKADVTHLDDDGQALLNELGAAGPPTMVFLNNKLSEPAGSRLIGATRPDAIATSAALTDGAS